MNFMVLVFFFWAITWVFPKILVPQNGWFKKMENPIKHGMIWGYHYFWKHPLKQKEKQHNSLVGGFTPFEKIFVKMGSSSPN